GDDGLARAAVAEQSQDDSDEVERLVQAVGGGVPGGGEGLVAGGAAEAPLLAGVDADVAQASLPPVQAVEVRAELRLRVQRVFLGNDGLAFIIQDTRWTRLPARRLPRSRLPGVLPHEPSARSDAA